MDNTIKTILIIFLFVLIFYLLSVLYSILIPLVLAFLFAILFQPIIRLLQKVHTPKWLVLPALSIITLAIVYGLSNILIGTTSDVISQKDWLLSRLDIRLNEILIWLSSITGQTYEITKISKILSDLLSSDWFSKAAGNFASGVGSVTGSFVMFSLYYIIILSGLSNYKQYIQYVAGSDNTNYIDTYEQIQKSIIAYMTTKTLINLSSGIIATVVCLAFGIKFAFLWGLLVFILHYIPSIGSVIASIPSLAMALIQFDSFHKVAIFFLILNGILFTIGNVVEPKIMGNQLRLNTLTVLFGLVFWGYIWGIGGMMLSVPFMVILKLIFEHFPTLSVFGRIMGYPVKEEVVTIN